MTNRGTAFTQEKHAKLGLIGYLLAVMETLDQQVMRGYQQYLSYEKHIHEYMLLGRCIIAMKPRINACSLTIWRECQLLYNDTTVGEVIRKWPRDYCHFCAENLNNPP